MTQIGIILHHKIFNRWFYFCRGCEKYYEDYKAKGLIWPVYEECIPIQFGVKCQVTGCTSVSKSFRPELPNLFERPEDVSAGVTDDILARVP